MNRMFKDVRWWDSKKYREYLLRLFAYLYINTPKTLSICKWILLLFRSCVENVGHFFCRQTEVPRLVLSRFSALVLWSFFLSLTVNFVNIQNTIFSFINFRSIKLREKQELNTCMIYDHRSNCSLSSSFIVRFAKQHQ